MGKDEIISSNRLPQSSRLLPKRLRRFHTVLICSVTGTDSCHACNEACNGESHLRRAMTRTAITLAFLLASLPVYAQTKSCQTSGTLTSCSEGSSAITNGNLTQYSDGTSSITNGGLTQYSDGTVVLHSGGLSVITKPDVPDITPDVPALPDTTETPDATPEEPDAP
jgi:hypothetical protein